MTLRNDVTINLTSDVQIHFRKALKQTFSASYSKSYTPNRPTDPRHHYKLTKVTSCLVISIDVYREPQFRREQDHILMSMRTRSSFWNVSVVIEVNKIICYRIILKVTLWSLWESTIATPFRIDKIWILDRFESSLFSRFQSISNQKQLLSAMSLEKLQPCVEADSTSDWDWDLYNLCLRSSFC